VKIHRTDSLMKQELCRFVLGSRTNLDKITGYSECLNFISFISSTDHDVIKMPFEIYCYIMGK
jgi:hypothetical protein